MRSFISLAAAAALASASALVPALAEDGDEASAETNAHAFSFHAQATPAMNPDGTPWAGPSFEAGEEVSLAAYAGHPILVVNTAAHCGYTPQFEGLQAVWEEYRDDGLMMIGVHQNNFRDQGGSEEELAEQCELYSVNFPQMEMVDVVGENSHAFYNWVREQSGEDNFPAWNFNKALIGADGELLATYGSGNIVNRSNVQPELIEEIEAALAS